METAPSNPPDLPASVPRAGRWPIVVAVLLHVLLLAGFVTYRIVHLFDPPRPGSFVGIALWVTLFAEISLAGIWLALGSSLLRFPYAAVVALVLPRVINELGEGGSRESEIWFALTTLEIVAVAGPLWALRGMGRRLQRPRSAAPPDRLQFQIRHLLYWMLGAALSLVVLRSVVGNVVNEDSLVGLLPVLLGCSLSYGLAGHLSVWLAFGGGHLGLRAIGFCLGLVGLGALYPYVMPWGRVEQIGVLLAQSFVVVTTLGAFYAAGYRLDSPSR